MIAAHAVSKRFGHVVAVDTLNLEIPRGGVVGFLGPNGAGKTTTLRMIVGYLAPSSGYIVVDGFDVQRHSKRVRQRIGYLPETAPLYSEMRVSEFLEFRARMFHIDRGQRRRTIDLSIRRCGLDEVRRRPIHQLSKGYRQRVGLAAALLHAPPLIILDEPTAGLDPAQIREVRALVRELAERHTIVLSTHILPEAELTCDRIVMMARGRVRAVGTLDELRTAAAHLSRYVVETDCVRAENIIRSIPGVCDVQGLAIDDKWRRLSVRGVDGQADLREQIAAALAKQSCAARELRREAPSLEHLFVQMIAAAEHDDGAHQ